MHRLSHEYPFWNRSGGADHVFFLTTDRGGCWRPWATQHSLIVSYLGFRAAEGYFGFEERLKWPRQPANDRNNAYSVRRGSEALGLDCYTAGKDVVVPVDAAIGGAEEAKLPAPKQPFACKRGPHKVLLFMGGSMTTPGLEELRSPTHDSRRAAPVWQGPARRPTAARRRRRASRASEPRITGLLWSRMFSRPGPRWGSTLKGLSLERQSSPSRP